MELTDGRISEFGYCFYTPQEIRSLSVLEISSDATFDRFTNRGIDGGLHDMALGPCNEKDICAHCGLGYVQCPGHMGHIEFFKPVYNPLLFDLVVRLLKSFCFSCFRIYNVDLLSACLELLGLPDILLPSKPKPSEIEDLRSLPSAELRKTAIRAMSTRPRIPCRNCSSKAWIPKHINHQQIVMRPVSDSRNSRFTGVNKYNVGDGDTEHEPGELECWAAIEAQLLCDKATSRPVVSFEDSTSQTTRIEFDDIAESVRERLKEISSGQQKEAFSSPELVRDMLRCVWLQDSSILRIIFPFLHAASAKFHYATDVCFMEVMPVSPSFCRWPRMVNGMAYEHPATALFSRVINRAIALRQIAEYLKENDLVGPQGLSKTSDVVSAAKQAQLSTVDGAAGHKISPTLMTAERATAALHASVIFLQAAVNAVYDVNISVLPTGFESRTRNATTVPLPGLKQRLEKKQGLFRMHMMGKRVNYACRSVISPDPNLRVFEVGVPLFIALKLTFPEPVTAHSIGKLRRLVRTGPDVYPGAIVVQMPDGSKQIIPPGNSEPAVARRLTMSKRLAIPQTGVHDGMPMIVHRHLEDGDYLVMNRQPTLHRPSIQAHRVRIIQAPGAKTLRLHYAICKAYNADFDGDEMNGHFPQTYQAKSEMTQLAAVPYQYLAPKDGSPLGGLIQDHVIAAVKLTTRDRFFDQDEYLDLVYNALYASVAEDGCLPDVILLPPAILKPSRLWTGKQVVSTLLMNVAPAGLPQLNAHIEGRRTKVELWAGVPFSRARILSDVDLVVVGGYLASGLLDKAHIGSASGGLVHCFYEAYGACAASQLLSGISRMADRFLKIASFTMSLADIMLNEKADKDRRKRFRKMQDLGLCAFADAFGLTADSLTEEKVQTLYRRAHFASTTDEIYGGKLAALDRAVKDRIKHSQDAVCDSSIPSGLYTPFPANSLQLMVHVGAKGGMVNAQQMSVALGQIELEGRRVPLMLSGRTLPSFPPYDVRPRAGGMCTHRFLTSMPPQELFFHSMAGRDGLIDTACKTSRSGYLQRSLIKHLEDLSVQYDGTVRDSGGGVIQFRYGDDGLDVCQSAFLKPAGINFFAENAELLTERWRCPNDPEVYQKMAENNPLSPDLAQKVDEVAVNRLNVLQMSLSTKKLAHLQKRRERAQRKLTEADYKTGLPDPPCTLAGDLRTIVTAKVIQGQVPPGEPVGLLAAQSIGEPSTQMTLNTFHFAGRGEMNVTLGIPRLREVLMAGSSVIATPCMEVPILPNPVAKAKAEHIARGMYKLRLTEVIKLPLGVEVDYSSDSCSLTFNLLPLSAYEARTNVRPQRIIRFFERVLFVDLSKRLAQELKDQGKSNAIASFNLRALARQQQAEWQDDGDEAGGRPGVGHDEWGENDGAEAVRRRRLEAEDEADPEVGARSGRNNANGEVIDEDDDEVAELREIGVDPEAAAAAEDQEAVGGDDDAAETWQDVGSSASANLLNKKANLPTPSKVKEVTEASGAEAIELERGEDDEEQGEELVFDNDADDGAQGSVKGLDQSRISFVKSLHHRFTDYSYDTQQPPSWVKLTISMFDPKDGRISIDLRTLVQRIVGRSVVSSVPNIRQAFIDKTDPLKWILRVEGVNVPELYRYGDVFDLTQLYTNHVHVMQEHFGVEAARASLQREISGVFDHYGIYVNPRHLGLVADYLTKTGLYRSFNRRTMDFHPSPMQRMTFETATSVLKSVIQEDLVESTVSPSGSIVPGQLTHGYGTTCFDLLTQLTI
uniref:DNA-directed RNA polymerase subunit n=2 Tax=Mesocestoides corti TaxID=53468 RepID=A0A5K3EH83_MESCO